MEQMGASDCCGTFGNDALGIDDINNCAFGERELDALGISSMDIGSEKGMDALLPRRSRLASLRGAPGAVPGGVASWPRFSACSEILISVRQQSTSDE